MREAVFILFVLFLLFGLTALRYRKQIAGILALGRTLREMREGTTTETAATKEKVPAALELRSCSGCGTWIDTNTAIKFDKNTLYCSKECVQRSMASS
ncbi:MAG TPA: hypothetical protein PLR83_01475 [Pyrinomonadaceae bacterium]|nr:hypothetical protein [Pyrinomonadaceae bacterium]